VTTSLSPSRRHTQARRTADECARKEDATRGECQRSSTDTHGRLVATYVCRYCYVGQHRRATTPYNRATTSGTHLLHPSLLPNHRSLSCVVTFDANAFCRLVAVPVVIIRSVDRSAVRRIILVFAVVAIDIIVIVKIISVGLNNKVTARSTIRCQIITSG